MCESTFGVFFFCQVFGPVLLNNFIHMRHPLRDFVPCCAMCRAPWAWHSVLPLQSEHMPCVCCEAKQIMPYSHVPTAFNTGFAMLTYGWAPKTYPHAAWPCTWYAFRIDHEPLVQREGEREFIVNISEASTSPGASLVAVVNDTDSARARALSASTPI
jgi:hypothetical protein